MQQESHLIIFDWDGTLMDSLSLIVRSFQHAADQMNLPIPGEGDVKPLIGLGLPEAIKAAFQGLELDEATLAAFRDHYAQIYVRESTTGQSLFPGARDLLEYLIESGHELAVATGKSRAGLDRALDQSGTRELFQFTRCADETQSKPNPQMLHEILEQSRLMPEKAVMVGDTHFDIEMAKSAGITPVAVSYGAQTLAMLKQSKPMYIADSITDLNQWLSGSLPVF